MDAIITAEDDAHIGLTVVDALENEHDFTLKKSDGEIVYHQCGSYADDPDERSDDENEFNNQARRFAKYYVFTERGYDTLEHARNPVYVDAVRRAIASLSSEGFERYFGALHQQLRSHHEDIERPVALPAGVRAPNAVVYKLDVFLGVDIAESGLEDRVRELADTHDLERSPSATELTGREVQRWAALGDELLEDTTAEDLTLEVGAVSGIHVGFPNARGEHEVQWADSPLERQPDARLELLPAEPGTLEEFQAFLDHHLRCQVRDRFVTMGLVPPEAFRVIGFGTFHDARRYDHYDLYPQLHLRDGEEGTLFS